MIPWRDVAIVRTAQQTLEIEGELSGDWKSERVAFRPARGADGQALAAAGAATRPDGGCELVRAALAGPVAPSDPARFDWRPGMLTVFRQIDARSLSFALGLFLLGQVIVITRWWRLLAAGGMRVAWPESL